MWNRVLSWFTSSLQFYLNWTRIYFIQEPNFTIKKGGTRLLSLSEFRVSSGMQYQILTNIYIYRHYRKIIQNAMCSFLSEICDILLHFLELCRRSRTALYNPVLFSSFLKTKNYTSYMFFYVYFVSIFVNLCTLGCPKMDLFRETFHNRGQRKAWVT